MPNPSFAAPETNPFGLTRVGYGDLTDPTFVDINNDGDLDAFVGDYDSNTYYFQNTGTASSPSFAAPQTNPFGLTRVGSYYSSPAFADLDGDGDLDAFVGEYSTGSIYYFQNTGTASSPSFAARQTNPFGLTTLGNNNLSQPTFADLDGDGDLDAFVGNNIGNIAYFKNIGTASSPSFAARQDNPFGFTYSGHYDSSPTFGDIDKDGDLDAFVGNQTIIAYFQNTGTASSPSFAALQNYPFGLTFTGSYNKPALADIDNDGDLDAFVGNSGGNIAYFKNNQAPTNLSLSPSSINENVAANSAVGTFTSTDPDTGNTFTYSLVTGTGDTNNSAFSIVSNQLQINASPDFETKPTFNIRLRTTDQGGLTYDKPLVVNINDIDEFVYGTPNNDILNGTASADQVNGGAGSDIIYGKAGNDIIDGGDGDDIVYGGNDNDLLRGGNGSDRIYGDAGNDQLLGEEGNDILYGGDGDDLLNGGAGSDQLYGNAGIDTFVLASGMGLDSIYNFQDGADKIRLDGDLNFGALQIAQSGTSTLIKIASTGVTLASLVNTNSALIGVGDFI
ncbi:FG-GAP-like repeat-containing protein [Microcoleus sp. T3B2]|uniref:FG-GAP-like repeat-containing protein n=1 Tax=Microcoleus sp. T3B2 TaxID=3055426 RepID=UPI002FD0E94F